LLLSAAPVFGQTYAEVASADSRLHIAADRVNLSFDLDPEIKAVIAANETALLAVNALRDEALAKLSADQHYRSILDEQVALRITIS
jgi:hypothetical protein